jgi:hypothetical protein
MFFIWTMWTQTNQNMHVTLVDNGPAGPVTLVDVTSSQTVQNISNGSASVQGTLTLTITNTSSDNPLNAISQSQSPEFNGVVKGAQYQVSVEDSLSPSNNDFNDVYASFSAFSSYG